MKWYLFVWIATVAILFTACETSKQAIIPTNEDLPQNDDNYTIIWSGIGESYTYIDGEYVRSESNDYSFEVVQRRYGNTWKSIKNMHRMHPDYDGRAGEREQTMYFELDFSRKGNEIVSTLNSSLGCGEGRSDSEFRGQQLQFAVDGISSFAPYNTMRITQHYKYEEGKLVETVELFKLKGTEETPFARIIEVASIFRPTELTEAPTTFSSSVNVVE
ncbi:MAG: hypothetical protein AAF806_28740 [Bacteroidota bacterium]